tara:strand:- start:778 stop:1119 length:342 start_codon:yes stop_codon:yes gene_type:complete
MNFFTYVESPFYKQISDWVDKNKDEDFYVYPSQQRDEYIYDFCSAVLGKNKIPILIVPNGGFNKKYPSTLQAAINLSDDVRVYEVCTIRTRNVIQSKAIQFTEVNGGVVWIRW